MFTTNKLYYLNQLGIIPWVKKTRQTLTIRPLVILLQDKKNAKEASLVDNIVKFLQPLATKLLTLDQYNIQTENPLAILALGTQVPAQYKGPTFPQLSLEALISKPTDKKKLFTDLQKIIILASND